MFYYKIEIFLYRNSENFECKTRRKSLCKNKKDTEGFLSLPDLPPSIYPPPIRYIYLNISSLSARIYLKRATIGV